jgi:hypothetical protein
MSQAADVVAFSLFLVIGAGALFFIGSICWIPIASIREGLRLHAEEPQNTLWRSITMVRRELRYGIGG